MKPSYWIAILAALFTSGAITVSQVKPKEPKEPKQPVGEYCDKVNVQDNTLQPFISTDVLVSQALSRGFTAERVFYADPAANAKGELQTRYYNLIHPKLTGGKARGVFYYFHGGGGDVGSADYQDVLKTCMNLAQLGFWVVDVEYRRGWTGTEPYDQWCSPDRDPHNETKEAYLREREAAHLSFEDAEIAVLDAYERINSPGIESHATGTSFGGTLAAHIAYGSDRIWKKINLQGCLNQYGGLSMADPLYATVPYFGVGGVADDFVPFWNGPTFVNENGEWIYGCGGLGLALGAMGVDYEIHGTCNKGHGLGAVTEQGAILSYLDFVEYTPRENRIEFYNKTNTAPYIEYVDSCNYSWKELRARLDG